MAKREPVQTHSVFRVYWEESERGWGVRPDGYSFHLTNEDAQEFIKDYWAGMPDGPAPDEYSRPGGDPESVQVGPNFYRRLKNNKKDGRHGIRSVDHAPKVDE